MYKVLPLMCGARDKANKITTFESEPDVLIIHLRLFVYGEATNRTKKKQANIHIDEEIKIFSQYTLQGIICHEGDSANTGHYTCCVKVNDKWYNANDSAVNDGKNNQIKPYVLVYKKIDDVEPRNYSITESIPSKCLQKENSPLDDVSVIDDHCDQKVYICSSCNSDIFIPTSQMPKTIGCSNCPALTLTLTISWKSL